MEVFVIMKRNRDWCGESEDEFILKDQAFSTEQKAIDFLKAYENYIAHPENLETPSGRAALGYRIDVLKLDAE